MVWNLGKNEYLFGFYSINWTSVEKGAPRLSKTVKKCTKTRKNQWNKQAFQACIMKETALLPEGSSFREESKYERRIVWNCVYIDGGDGWIWRNAAWIQSARISRTRWPLPYLRVAWKWARGVQRWEQFGTRTPNLPNRCARQSHAVRTFGRFAGSLPLRRAWSIPVKIWKNVKNTLQFGDFMI